MTLNPTGYWNTPHRFTVGLNIKLTAYVPQAKVDNVLFPLPAHAQQQTYLTVIQLSG